MPVHFADGVAAAGTPDCQRCHIEMSVVAAAVFSEREQGVSGFLIETLEVHQLLLNPFLWKGVMARRYRRVRREDGAGADHLPRFIERIAGFQQFTNPLEDDE